MVEDDDDDNSNNNNNNKKKNATTTVIMDIRWRTRMGDTECNNQGRASETRIGTSTLWTTTSCLLEHTIPSNEVGKWLLT